MSNNQYVMGQDGDSSSETGDPSGEDGMEYGTYTITESGEISFSASLDTNGDWGLSGASFSWNADADGNLYFDEGDEYITLSKIIDDGIYGSWTLGEGENTIVITFLEDGTFMLVDASASSSGIETGKYSLDEATYITFTIATDTNGESGVSNPAGGSYTLTVNGDVLKITDSDGSSVFSRVTSAVPVPAAVWLLGSGLVGLVGLNKKRKR
nr:VPLPA-CTERM sorting domain-containing protein [uncultured Desulfobacter sp.]